MTMKIGMIGLDTSHVSIFAKMLHDKTHPYHVPGGRVTAAFPGGSPDFELSSGRVEGYTKEIAEWGTAILETPEEVAKQVDAVMLEAVDGRSHLSLFRAIAPYSKLVFIDKPFAVTSRDAREIVELAEQYQVTVMSSSSLRYAQGLQDELASGGEEDIIGVDCAGPLPLQPTQPGFFWYGIHTAEMLYRVFGPGCVSVHVAATEEHEVLTAVWNDGRIGTIRGNRSGNERFGVTIHRKESSRFVDIMEHPKPYYASLLDQIMQMFTTGVSDVPLEETLELIRFLEAANVSRETGETLRLNEIK
ncbi:Gfo/Idh/MocA family protein [Paenibacillus solani]|uniref:Oxidoreductase n=1 Tax=Paenibacillus solani TaxID=1705565 RepID=A0A0M1P6N8_9BACL|nr:Gfo/Idh/MocA family oxidoreductase [Paenibacillus solani]KOR90148.1 oxidoreductase [Paenibacillus solani]